MIYKEGEDFPYNEFIDLDVFMCESNLGQRLTEGFELLDQDVPHEVSAESPLPVDIQATPPATLACAVCRESHDVVEELLDAHADINGERCNGSDVSYHWHRGETKRNLAIARKALKGEHEVFKPTVGHDHLSWAAFVYVAIEGCKEEVWVSRERFDTQKGAEQYLKKVFLPGTIRLYRYYRMKKDKEPSDG